MAGQTQSLHLDSWNRDGWGVIGFTVSHDKDLLSPPHLNLGILTHSDHLERGSQRMQGGVMWEKIEQTELEIAPEGLASSGRKKRTKATKGRGKNRTAEKRMTFYLRVIDRYERWKDIRAVNMKGLTEKQNRKSKCHWTLVMPFWTLEKCSFGQSVASSKICSILWHSS